MAPDMEADTRSEDGRIYLWWNFILIGEIDEQAIIAKPRRKPQPNESLNTWLEIQVLFGKTGLKCSLLGNEI